MQRIIIFANGDLPDLERARRLLRPDDFFLCADGGTRHALALDLTPDLVIGDMDSTGKDQLRELSEAGVPLELFPRNKNETDLELAISKAVGFKPTEIVIIGALGGRMDQALANIALLTDPRLFAVDVRLDDGVEEILLCRDQVQVRGGGGDFVSLIPWGGPVDGIQTEYLKWPLDRETLVPEKTRGISNEMIAETAGIRIQSGMLLIVHRRTPSSERLV
jgi:thiamine pyrophosphokinase